MAEKKTAPVILFTYNRPEHTRRTIEALAKNELAQDTELFVFSDAAKKEADRGQSTGNPRLRGAGRRLFSK